jgi:hypothetical protein
MVWMVWMVWMVCECGEGGLVRYIAFNKYFKHMHMGFSYLVFFSNVVCHMSHLVDF